MSSRRKGETPKYMPITSITSTMVAPEWTDMLRGLLLALLEGKRPLWDTRFRTNKDRCLQLAQEIADVLSNQDERINLYAVLEKLCWMTEMYYRATDIKGWTWRYASAMSYIGEFASNGSHFLLCLSNERFEELTKLYSVSSEELAVMKAQLPARCKKHAKCWFKEEVDLYSRRTKIVNAPLVLIPASAQSIPIPTASSIIKIEPRTPSLRSIKTRSSTAHLLPAENLIEKTETKQQIPLFAPISIAVSAPLSTGATAESESSVRTARVEIKTEGEESEPQPILPSSSPIPTSSGEQVPARSGESWSWSSEMINALIDAVKDRPALWHANHPHYRSPLMRKDYVSEVALIVSNVAGAPIVNEDQVSGKWSILREGFNKQHKKVKAGGSSSWEFYNKLQFLSPQVMLACKFDDFSGDTTLRTQTPSLTTVVPTTITAALAEPSEDISLQLKRFLGYIPDALSRSPSQGGEASPQPPAPKRRRKNSPPQEARNVNGTVPQIVATWVPPREDSIAAAMQAMQPLSPSAATSTSSVPTATAQIVSTSSDTLASLLRRELRPSPIVNQSMSASYVSNGQLKAFNEGADKWKHLGVLIETTCREIESKDASLAFQLQKEINDTIFRFQMRTTQSRRGPDNQTR